MEIKFQYKLEDSDFKAAAKVVSKRVMPGAIKNLIALIVLYGSIYVLGCVMDSQFLFASGAVLGMFGMVLCGVLNYRIQIVKTWKTIPSMHQTNVATVSVEALIHEGVTWHTKYLWSHFQEFLETETHFFLMVGRHPSLWFPKRVISQSDQTALRSLLTSQFSSK